MAKKSVKNKSEKKPKNIPTSVRTLSVLFYVFAVISILFGVILLVAGLGANAYVNAIGEEAVVQQFVELNQKAGGDLGGVELSDINTIKSLLFFVGVVGGIVTLLLGILYIFVGRGLARKQRWAWITAIILVVLGILRYVISSVVGGGSSLIMLIVLLVMGYFLLFDKKVRKYFVRV